MVNYSASATALLALSSQVITAINAERSESVRRDGRERQGLRKLSGVDETDVQTRCEQVIEGSPLVCVKVCVTVTSMKKDDDTIEEYSEVKQEKCASGWENDGNWKGDTEWPTYSPTQTYGPTQGDDEHDIVDWTDDGWKSYSKDNSWKCTPKPGKPSWSAPVNDEWEHPTWTPPAWSVDEEHYTTSKASKGGKGGKSSKGGKGGYLTKTSTDHDPAWDAPAPEHDAWTGGARRLGSGKNNADRMLVWPFKSWDATPAPKAKEWAAAPDEPKWGGSGKGTAKSWSSPTPKKTEWTATSKTKYGKSNKDKAKVAAWPSPSGWKSSSMPSICKPSTVVPTLSPSPTYTPTTPASPTTSASPTTCQGRKWYYDNDICSNVNNGEGTYSDLQDCCDENSQEGQDCSFEDVCCPEREWYYDGDICSNGIPPEEGTRYDTKDLCCEAEQPGVECTYADFCNTSTPSTVESFSTPPPSVIITPQPSSQNPTFGSTPTVSKEVTGPPTRGRS